MHEAHYIVWLVEDRNGVGGFSWYINPPNVIILFVLMSVYLFLLLPKNDKYIL